MRISILRETQAGETRVAATPDTVSKYIALGAEVAVEPGAGEGAGVADAAYEAAGARIAADAIRGADIILCVRRPDPARLEGVNAGALIIGMLDPHGAGAALAEIARRGLSAFAMELMPRITRAQVMDVLSSQANLAGYQAVIEAAAAFGRAMPQMMTAAGTVRPAKVFVMGAGVAGLQAIATARRLGAIVSATDVRAAAGEQVASLGAKFIMTDALKDASGSGGYARELTPEEQAAQAALVADHIAKQDIVITTALIPGRPAPRLVTQAMVEAMAPGSVIVDLAAERGGNVELTVPDQRVEHHGVAVLGPTNLASRIAATASQLYARNLYAFVETLVDKAKGALAISWDDDLVKATLLTRDGAIVHSNFVPEAPVAASAPSEPGLSDAVPARTRAARTRKSATEAASEPSVKPPRRPRPAAKPAEPKPPGQRRRKTET